MIDFTRDKDGVPAKVASIQYDPNRNARIALLHYVDGEKRYILAPDGLKVGQTVENGPDAPPTVGNCLPLQPHSARHARFTTSRCSRAAALACAAVPASSATLMAREADWAQITLPSGEIRRVPAGCRATIGQVGNSRRDERRDRQGRPQSLEGHSAARPRHGDEPDRPSARWW